MSKSFFYGVYLLCSQSAEKRYNGRCYIGFTVNPGRRINQHNKGKDFGGAKRTNNKGPWQMVMIVHGFPNNISALQFEWAWQQPALSTRLKQYSELRRKFPKESHFQYHFRILSRMLNVGPWNRLPLSIHWLENEYECDFNLKPPPHMEILRGHVLLPKSQSTRLRNGEEPPKAIWAPECHLCMQRIDDPEDSRIGCINSLCKLTCHIICLANYMLSSDENNRGHYIPIAGECPLCEEKFTWIALLQRKRKMQQSDVEQIEEEDEDDEYEDEYDSDISVIKSDKENESVDSIKSNEFDDPDLLETPVLEETDIPIINGNQVEIYELSD